MKDAHALVGVTEYTDTVEGRTVTPAVRVLNSMLGSWSLDAYLNPKIGYRQVASSALTNGYITVGSANALNDIPDDIIEISKVTVSMGTLTYPALNKISFADYTAIPIKNITSIPYSFAFDYQDPLGKIYVYPLPNTSLSINVTYTPAMAVAQTASDTLDLPGWMYEALLYNLACRLAPIYPAQGGIDMSLIKLASSAKSELRTRMSSAMNLKADSAYGNGSVGGSIWTSPINMLGSN